MATKAPTTPDRETWDDWLPPNTPSADRLLTRDKLVAELHKFGVKADANDFRFWESVGVLPRPIRRWHDGATRTLYPKTAMTVVMELRELQERGYTLKQIAPRLRLFVRSAWAADPHNIADAVNDLARRHEELTGRKIWRVDVQFTDEDNREERFVYFTQPTDSEE